MFGVLGLQGWLSKEGNIQENLSKRNNDKD